MKKAISVVIFLIAFIFVLPSCASRRMGIEECNWKMRCVMHGGEEGVIVDAVGREDGAHPDAKIIDMTLVAEDGKITIFGFTNNKTYDGTYSVENKTPAGTDYKITINGITGYATVAFTSYKDGGKEPTLPINLGTHSLYFYAE